MMTDYLLFILQALAASAVTAVALLFTLDWLRQEVKCENS